MKSSKLRGFEYKHKCRAPLKLNSTDKITDIIHPLVIWTILITFMTILMTILTMMMIILAIMMNRGQESWESWGTTSRDKNA